MSNRDLSSARSDAMRLTQADDPAALAAWQQVLALAPNDPEAHFQLGNAAGDRGDFPRAIAHLEAARRALPRHPVLLNNLALAHEAQGELDSAIERLREAAGVDPRAAAVVRPSLARVLYRAGRYDAALVELESLVAAGRPDPAWLAARAVCLAELGRDADALPAYRAALAAQPRSTPVWHDFVRWLLARSRFDDADAALSDAHAALPDDTLILSLLVVSRQRRGDFQDVPALRAELVGRVADPRWQGSASGYDFTAVCDDPGLQRRVAERYAASESGPVAAASWSARVSIPQRGDAAARLHIAFVSSDYRDHPVGRLVVPLLERLDRARFDVTAYSTGRADDVVGNRIAAAGVRLAALPRRDPLAAAACVRADGVDILVDLNGFSGGEALRIFAARPAALQVNFLGYTGTLGSAAYDVLVTDRYCIAPDARSHYAEAPLYVDPCYLPSDPHRAVGDATDRAAYGLPGDALVLHAGAALYKVSPELFAAWLAILRDVPRSVLWMRASPPASVARLRFAAAKAGIDGARLHFAPAESVERYLARFALADLMLDTAPFGAHTTVNDALYMGVPVVSVAGRSFAGRASASQLVAAGLEELVAPDLARYADLARALAGDPAQLDSARERLRDVRRRALFDADRYAAAFAEALIAAWRGR
jgi:predicted O-linked N-acetylglucosamine transferase (SPINDLY family)